MIWAAIWGDQKCDTFALNRDFESEKFGYTANSYIELLEECLLAIWEPGLLFMQDNAPIHKAKKTKRWFEDHGITPIFWPRYFLDLNPIEQLWFELKERVHNNNPELETMGDTEAARQPMILAISRAWSEIPEKRIEELVKSMETRINAVIEAEG